MKKLKLVFIGFLAGLFAVISLMVQRRSINAMARDKAEWAPKKGDLDVDGIIKKKRNFYKAVLAVEKKKLKTESKAHLVAEFKERFK